MQLIIPEVGIVASAGISNLGNMSISTDCILDILFVGHPFEILWHIIFSVVIDMVDLQPFFISVYEFASD